MNGMVVLLSGGLDSSTLLYNCVDIFGKGSVKALAIHYGQRHVRELHAAEEIAKGAGVPLEYAKLPTKLFEGSSQTSASIEVPEGHYADENMKMTVVPNRNMVLLSLAAAYAISVDYAGVAYAAHAGDHTIYPDCRPDFVRRMFELLATANWKAISLYTPFLNFTKADIVIRGRTLKVPFAATWSCYKGGEVHCGRCGTCVERREAFKLAGVVDPTTYEVA